jgi:transcriptional antiterminator RfaH
MDTWHLLYCKARNEARSVLNLENQGLMAFYPQFTRSRLVRGKRTLVTEAIFPSYVFVCMGDNGNYNAVRSTRGVSDFVRIGNAPIEVPEELIDNLMLHSEHCCFSEQLQQMLSDMPKLGDKVVIAEGIYRGLEAIYQKADGLERSVLLIKLLNQDVSLTLDNRAFSA